jgi:general secretion pathway protein F
MPVYAYKGIAANGKQTSGIREADSPKTLRQALRKDGVVVTDFDISKGGKAGAKVAGKGLSREVKLGDIFGGINKTDIAAFTRQLATLLNAGIPLAECLAALFEQIEQPKLKTIVGEVRTAVNEGSSLADGLAKHPRVFDELFVSMVRAGETAGNLDEVLKRLADFLESAGRLRSKITGAMVYPVVMIVVSSVIMAILMIAVVPKVTKLLERRNQELPLSTELLMGFTNFVGTWWWLLMLLIIGGIIGFVAWWRSPEGRFKWHSMVLKMWVIGPLARRLAISRFARTLGTMLTAGVPMLRALETARATMGNRVLEKAVDASRTAVTEGESLAVTLRKTGHFPPTVTHMIGVGEKAGELEQMLVRVADAYDAEVDARVTRLTSMLEPLMIVGMGLGVGFIVYAILKPIMDMSNM